MQLVVFRPKERRMELLIISVYLFWVLHCVTHILRRHSCYNEQNPECLHVDTKTNKNAYAYYYYYYYYY